ncbi:MAG: PIN domain-containing protein [Microcystis novacekii Mn_MB_F_20050700_S1]|nr:MAG: PIN domain-containing protein [Microcystis novacekii Mn_MB_F_20050700_S1]
MTAEPRVVLDACVLIPQYLRDTLLSIAWRGLYSPYWSKLILEETTKAQLFVGWVSALRNIIGRWVSCFNPTYVHLIFNSTHLLNITSIKALNLVETMKAAFPEAMIEVPSGLIELMTNDLKDRHVLATAVMAKANLILTNNFPDFSLSALETWGIKAQSPDTFLSHLFDEYPEEIKFSLNRQVKKYKNPQKTLAELLEFLDKKANLSNFCQKITKIL